MKCPYCGSTDNGVVDSRETEDGHAIRRRRSCASCARRFTTYERIDEVALLVIKKDGSREAFDRNKLIAGMTRACQKRPVPVARIERIGAEIEKRAAELGEREISSRWFGEQVMEALRELDQVAYVRYASVYRSFRDVDEFARELEALRGERSGPLLAAGERLASTTAGISERQSERPSERPAPHGGERLNERANERGFEPVAPGRA